MIGILIKVGINSAAIWAAAYYVDGMELNTESIVGVLTVGALFGLINTFLKPVVKILAMPAVFLSLGLLTFAINGLMLWFTAVLTESLTITTFGAVLYGSVVVGLASFVLSLVVPK